MGGKNEFVAEAKTKDGISIGSIRIHESNREIHFHDDDKKLKCAMPVAEWYEAWQRMSKRLGDSYRYFDSVNNVVLFAELNVDNGVLPVGIKLVVNIQKVVVSPEVSSMMKLMGG